MITSIHITASSRDEDACNCFIDEKDAVEYLNRMKAQGYWLVHVVIWKHCGAMFVIIRNRY